LLKLARRSLLPFAGLSSLDARRSRNLKILSGKLKILSGRTFAEGEITSDPMDPLGVPVEHLPRQDGQRARGVLPKAAGAS
jgi:hypothetical protein